MRHPHSTCNIHESSLWGSGLRLTDRQEWACRRSAEDVQPLHPRVEHKLDVLRMHPIDWKAHEISDEISTKADAEGT